MPKTIDKSDTIRSDLLKIYATYKGKGGDPESETIVLDSNGDKEKTFDGKAPNGVVSVWSDKKDIALIIERVGKAIVAFEEMPTGVQLYIDRRYFRGAVYAFKVVK